VFLSQSIHPEDESANDALFASKIANPSDKITQSLQQTLDAYMNLDFIVGMRLHSLILAFRHSIPFLALSYETKTNKFLESIDYTHALETKNADIDSFIHQFEALESESERVKFDLIKKNDTIQELFEKQLNAVMLNLKTIL